MRSEIFFYNLAEFVFEYLLFCEVAVKVCLSSLKPNRRENSEKLNEHKAKRKHFTSFILLSLDNSNIFIYLFIMRLLFPL